MTDELYPAFLRRDPEWEARKERLWTLTPQERVAAMRAGELSYRELAHWSAVRPDEVPRLLTGNGDLFGGGEFEWIAAFTPEIADAPGAAPPRRADQRDGTQQKKAKRRT